MVQKGVKDASLSINRTSTVIISSNTKYYKTMTTVVSMLDDESCDL